MLEARAVLAVRPSRRRPLWNKGLHKTQVSGPSRDTSLINGPPNGHHLPGNYDDDKARLSKFSNN